MLPQWVSAQVLPTLTSATRGQDVPEIAGLEAWVLHHLQQQVRRGLGQSFRGLQEDLVIDDMAEPDPRQV